MTNNNIQHLQRQQEELNIQLAQQQQNMPPNNFRAAEQAPQGQPLQGTPIHDLTSNTHVWNPQTNSAAPSTRAAEVAGKGKQVIPQPNLLRLTGSMFP